MSNDASTWTSIYTTPTGTGGTQTLNVYSEGLDVGYRWYDANNVTPLFPFGYGMSYTSFGFSNLQVGPMVNGQATVTATVTDTGSVSLSAPVTANPQS